MEEVEKREMTSLTRHGAAVGPFHMNAPYGPNSPWRTECDDPTIQPRRALLLPEETTKWPNETSPGNNLFRDLGGLLINQVKVLYSLEQVA